MKATNVFASLTALSSFAYAAPKEKRQSSRESEVTGFGFENGQPQSVEGVGGPLLGGTNHQIDLENPANLGAESTDNGVVRSTGKDIPMLDCSLRHA